MAQFLTLHKLKENDIKEHFYIDSAATGDRQIGKGIAPGTIQKLEENNIEYQERYARMLLKEEYGDFDYIVAMDESIKEDILKIGFVRSYISLIASFKRVGVFSFFTSPIKL